MNDSLMEREIELFEFDWWQSALWHALGLIATVAYVVMIATAPSIIDGGGRLFGIWLLLAVVPLTYLAALPDLFYMRSVPLLIRFKNTRFITRGPFGKLNSIAYLRVREVYTGQFRRQEERVDKPSASRFSMGLVLDDGTHILLNPKAMIDPGAVVAAIKADNSKCLVFERPIQTISQAQVVAFIAVPAIALALVGARLSLWGQDLQHDFQHWVDFGSAGSIEVRYGDVVITLDSAESAIVGKELKRGDAHSTGSQPVTSGGPFEATRIVLSVGTTKRLQILVETDAKCDSLFWLKADTFLEHDFSMLRSRKLLDLLCRHKPRN